MQFHRSLEMQPDIFLDSLIRLSIQRVLERTTKLAIKKPLDERLYE